MSSFYHEQGPRPYAALLRVSSKQQAIRGTIADQEREVRAWAERNGIDPDSQIYFFKDDGISGDEYIFDRPEGELDPLTRDRLKNLGYID